VPVFVPIRQNFPHRALKDVAGAVRAELEESSVASSAPRGARIAIGAGSRGISNIAPIIRATVDFWKSRGCRPFIFPAMGSHGAGTPEGQARVLAHYGIDERTMECPIVSSFDVLPLGRTNLGIDVVASRDAWTSHGIFLVNRIKWHTSFAGAIESGVTKMTAIGLGKIDGARVYHAHAKKLGMEAVIRSVGEHVLATGKVIGGLGILEDAYHDTAKVAVLSAPSLIRCEEELLRLAKTWMPRLPFPAVDVLIIDEMGKNISGTGVDLKIVNRGVVNMFNPWPDTAQVERIFVRDLSTLSYGNGNGVGVADVIHDRLLEKFDYKAGMVNAVTSGSLALMRVPLHFSSDRECFEVVANSVGKFDPEDITVAWIRNTLELGSMAVSRNLLDAITVGSEVELAGPERALEYDGDGNFVNRW
jgi:hypothetical protein